MYASVRGALTKIKVRIVNPRKAKVWRCKIITSGRHRKVDIFLFFTKVQFQSRLKKLQP